jgi:hypothetical protein
MPTRLSEKICKWARELPDNFLASPDYHRIYAEIAYLAEQLYGNITPHCIRHTKPFLRDLLIGSYRYLPTGINAPSSA